MDEADLKKFLKKYNLKPNFTYGQNFLIDESVLDEIVEASSVSLSDQVLEIGPGVGNLTEKLLQKAKFVLSVEKDKKFLSILKTIKKAHKNFDFAVEDFLKFNFQKAFKNYNPPPLKGGAKGGWMLEEKYQKSVLPSSNLPHQGEGKLGGYKVVANIPYFITGKILRKLLAAKYKPKSITILTQKEVAKNIVAKKGSLSISAIAVQIFGEPKIVKIVKAKSFYPIPKVDSSILHIELFRKPKYDIPDEKRFFKVLKSCFLGKRKQIHNTLASNLHLNKEFALRILGQLKIDPAARPQELSIEDWIGLVNKIKDKK